MVTITTRQTNRKVSKRDIQLVDRTERVVTLTLWGAEAEGFDGSKNPVMAIKGAKVSDFGGVFGDGFVLMDHVSVLGNYSISILIVIFDQDNCCTVESLYYKPLNCRNLYNKDTILCPSVVL